MKLMHTPEQRAGASERMKQYNQSPEKRAMVAAQKRGEHGRGFACD